MAKIVYITRRERFNAAHKLFKEEWSVEQNAEVFGKCSNPNWHGHNYELFVTVKGEVDATTGFVTNLKEVSKLVKERVTQKMDHKNMNLDVDFMKGIMPTTENLAIAIWGEIAVGIKQMGAELHSVKISETENNFAEYKGE